MAIPQAAEAARRAAQAARAAASSLRRRRDGGKGAPGKAAAVAVALSGLLFVAAYCFYVSPMTLIFLAGQAATGAFGAPDARGRYELPETTAAASLVEWALAEAAGGTHDGGAEYVAHCGGAPGESWCSYFVLAGWDACGLDSAIGRRAGGMANSWISWAADDPSAGALVRMDGAYAPEAGDIAVKGQPHGESVHVAIVVADGEAGGAIEVVEGNNGYGQVGHRTYAPGYFDWAFRPAYPSRGADIGGAAIGAREIGWYRAEAARLANWARSRWPVGERGSVKTPSWQWLWALDTVRDGNDFSRVLADEASYRAFHESVLRATCRTSEVENWVLSFTDGAGNAVTRRTAGAVLVDNGDGTASWAVYVNEPVTVRYWDVSYRSFKEIFLSVNGTLSEEFKYYGAHECGEYGDGWGDDGHALGYYQFDVRYDLAEFVSYAYAADPKAFRMLEPYTGRDEFSQYEPGLAEAWQAAYAADPGKWAELQDAWEWETAGQPAMDELEGRGIPMAGRRDCVKGLVTGLYNWRPAWVPRWIEEAGLSASMSDLEFAEALLGVVIEEFSGTIFENRWRSELEEVRAWLAQPPAEPAPDLGDGYGELQVQLADNYYRATRYLTARGGRVYLDARGFSDYLVHYTSGRVDSRYSEHSDAIVSASARVGSPGENLCAMWVSQVYAEAGLGYPGGNACDMYYQYCTSSDMADLEPGMIVAVPDTGRGAMGRMYGHVGIYIGEVDGEPTVRDNIGEISESGLEEWVATYGGVCEVRWGYAFDF